MSSRGRLLADLSRDEALLVRWLGSGTFEGCSLIGGDGDGNGDSRACLRAGVHSGSRSERCRFEGLTGLGEDMSRLIVIQDGSE